MNDMECKKHHIWELAKLLTGKGAHMSGRELANDLNMNGYLTSYGEAYKGGRGTYSLIRATYHWLDTEQHMRQEADKVAVAFVKPDGTYAYK